MARSHPVAALLLLAAAVAGCIGGTPSDTVDGGVDPEAIRHLGTWENPDEPIVATNATDVTGDGVDEVFAAQRNGSITALEPNRTQTLWQSSYGSGLADMVGVGGERGPALAVVNDALGLPGGGLTLVEAANGDVLARRDLGEIQPEFVDAADVNGDDVPDLVVAGVTLRPGEDLSYSYPQTAVVAVDGRFEDQGLLGGTLMDDDQLWRRQFAGYPVDLDATGQRVHIATDDGLVALDGDGQTVYRRDVDGLRDVAVAGSGTLVASAEKARWLDADGEPTWSRNVSAGGGAAVAIGSVGPIASVAAVAEQDNVTVHGFEADGDVAWSRPGANLTAVADVHVLDVHADAARIAVAGVTPEDDAGVLLVGSDGSRTDLVVLGSGDDDDRLASADVHPDAGRELLLARYDGYLEYLVG